jgi:hypothetical protein
MPPGHNMRLCSSTEFFIAVAFFLSQKFFLKCYVDFYGFLFPEDIFKVVFCNVKIIDTIIS